MRMQPINLQIELIDPLSPIQFQQTSPHLNEPQLEELKSLSQRTQSELKTVPSDKKMQRFEEKFPTHQQIFRVNSLNSLQGAISSNRNHEFYCFPNQS